MYVVYGKESGEMLEFQTWRQALDWIKDTERFDAENGLDGENWTIKKE